MHDWYDFPVHINARWTGLDSFHDLHKFNDTTDGVAYYDWQFVRNETYLAVVVWSWSNYPARVIKNLHA